MPKPIKPIFIALSRAFSSSPPLFKHVLGDQSCGHRRRPARIKGEMRDDFTDLILGDAIVERALQMADQLLFAAKRDQGRAGDQAAVPLGQLRALPNIPEQDLFAEVDQLWNDVADLVAGGGGLRLRHGFLLYWIQQFPSAPNLARV